MVAARAPDQLGRLHVLLREWARREKNWSPSSELGLPSQVPYVSLMRPGFFHEAAREAEYDRLDEWKTAALDAHIESLPGILRSALKARWLDDQDSTMADLAEEQLLAIITRRGVLVL